MPDSLIVEYCSPTLAGIKTANLFSYEYENKSEVYAEVARLSRLLARKGLKALVAGFKKGRALVYIYRPAYLMRDIRSDKARRVLESLGYRTDDCDACVRRMLRHLRDDEAFPHEIGFFLGYPPEDVIGFMKNKAEKPKYTGYWKVYGDVKSAIDTFDRYKKCTDSYEKQLSTGKTLEDLVVECG